MVGSDHNEPEETLVKLLFQVLVLFAEDRVLLDHNFVYWPPESRLLAYCPVVLSPVY